MSHAGTSTGIRTPDQRLRVFVSSTLRELAAERKVARQAIERIAAAPVMFELGARPHPPRELYRAYLEQSDIFVGLYWEKYGWVAPGETVSGLEDEYNLAPPTMPRLIYLKESAGQREERLSELVERIKSDDRASFKYFSTADELGDLLVADLAVLLAERFDLSRTAPAVDPPAHPEPAAPPATAPVAALPAPLTELYGRAEDIDRVAGMLRSPEVRLVTLLGPGGIGKTRLAIEVARALAPDFPDGLYFVPLAAVEDPLLVPDAVAQALGIPNSDSPPLEARLALALGGRRTLLVLDNFEQVLPAAAFLAGMLEHAPLVTMLVTSRALLRLTGEHAVEVPPLRLPSPSSGPWRPGDRVSPAVALFVDRARAVKPDFELTADNISAVEAICARLDGVPLALELAAARLRLLAPATLLERLDRGLALLVGGQRDLPLRHQAVRNTIEWSTRLLEPDERELLWNLGVFSGRFSLEAVEAVAPPGADALSLLEALVDTSLVRQQDRGGRSLFLLLGTVREYALEQLEREGRLEEVRRRHADHYLAWTRTIGSGLIGPRQWDQVAVLADQRDDLRAAARHLLEARRWSDAAEFAWVILPYWWMDGLLTEMHGWMETILASGDELSDRTRAIALCLANTAFFWGQADSSVVEGLTESADLFEKLGADYDAGVPLGSLAMAYLNGSAADPVLAKATIERGLRLFRSAGNRWGEAVMLVAKGRLQEALGDPAGGVATLQEALRLGEEVHDFLAHTMSLTNLGWAYIRRGSLRDAAPLIEETLDEALAQSNDQSVAWALEAFAGIAARQDDIERAGILRGATEVLRERIGLDEHADGITAVLEPIRSGPHGALFERSRLRGRHLSIDEALPVAAAVADAAEMVPPFAGVGDRTGGASVPDGLATMPRAVADGAQTEQARTP